MSLTNLATKKKVTYQIVSEKEADLKQSQISTSSPIGKGLLAKAVGEIAEIKAPAPQSASMVAALDKYLAQTEVVAKKK